MAIIGINIRYLQSTVTGIENYILNLVKNIGIVDQKNKYIFFQCSKSPVNRVTESDHHLYFFSKFPTKKTFLRIFWEQFFLAWEIKKNKCNVFHGPSYVVPVFKVCKYVLNIHDLSWKYYPKSFTFLNRLYLNIFLKLSIKKADKIIVISESTKQDVLKFFPFCKNKIKIIYLACDSKFQPKKDEDKCRRIKEKYGLPDQFILAVSTLLPRKNFEGLIKAYLQIADDIPHKLVIVGKKGWLYHDIFKNIDQFKDKIIFTDYITQDDLPYFYQMADLFVFVSFYEGFGLPLLEAMACGCPVLTSNVSSMPEVVGDAGYLVDPHNIDEISQAIKRILQDKNLKEQMIEKGFLQSKKFSWEKCARETVAVYEELL